jgi:hypothetical protein
MILIENARKTNINHIQFYDLTKKLTSFFWFANSDSPATCKSRIFITRYLVSFMNAKYKPQKCNSYTCFYIKITIYMYTIWRYSSIYDVNCINVEQSSQWKYQMCWYNWRWNCRRNMLWKREYMWGYVIFVWSKMCLLEHDILWFEVLTAPIMKTSLLGNIIQCNPLKVNRRFGTRCCLYVSRWIVSEARNQHKKTGRQRRYISSKRWLIFNGLHCVVPQKTEIIKT